MARIRAIKPDFFRDEHLQDLESAHPELHPMLVFAGLWTVADKDGHFEWLPRTLKLDILPFLDFDMSASLLLLREARRLSQYEVDDKTYGAVVNFKKHQRINGKEAQEPAKFPAPSTGSNGEAIEKHLRSQEGKGKEGEGDASPVLPREATEKHFTCGTSEEPTMDLHPLNYATKVLEEIGMPSTRSNMETIAATVKTVMAEGKTGESACEFLIAVVRNARDEGIVVDRFFFEDMKWKRNGKLPVKLPADYVSASEKRRIELREQQAVTQ
jgi:hypothetical protein